MLKFDSTINRLYTIGIIEAISYLLLLGIAMPLKYLLAQPEAVQHIGMAHGILWLIYIVFVLMGQLQYNWSYKISGILFIASLLPFGPIIADKKLLQKWH